MLAGPSCSTVRGAASTVLCRSHSHQEAVAASLATGEVYVTTLAQMEKFPDDIETINDMSEHGIPSFRI